MQNILIKNAASVLTMSGAKTGEIGQLKDTSLWIKDGIIQAIGSDEEISTLIKDERLDAMIDGHGKTVLPGFVDCHTHVLFGQSRVAEYAVKLTDTNPETLAKMGIETGIYASVNLTRSLSAPEILAQTERRLIAMLLSGSTTVESKSGYALTAPGEINMLYMNQTLNERLPLDIISTFLGAHGWPADMSKADYIKVLTEQMIPQVAAEKLAKFCDIWCDDGYYTAEESELVLGKGAEYGLIPRIHTDAYSYVGGSDLAIKMKMASADHLNYAPPGMFERLAAADVVGVFLPATEFAVNHPLPAKPAEMIKAGMTLALASNCCPGSWVESMQFVIVLACRLYGLSPEQALHAATYGGAKALRLEDRGCLKVGAKADIQVWQTDNYQDVTYKYGANLVETVLKDGKIVVHRGKLIG